ncbi:MAG: hypothetical protein HOU81_25150 [Hamadaea sp.]|uniref:hypothetical protein n=1 Tax=Hamadaea sp. TaxID=2024425 RepID=UPI00183A4955|nr:hypothetical protein [Hamadaea sp.]NUR74109.1 hypothetical protein [Hamadaea sp.]NUT19984.1 hypothetical protein [Hamadaea sp.]
MEPEIIEAVLFPRIFAAVGAVTQLLMLATTYAVVEGRGWPSTAITLIMVAIALVESFMVLVQLPRLPRPAASRETIPAGVRTHLLMRTAIAIAPGLFGIVLAFQADTITPAIVLCAVSLVLLVLVFPTERTVSPLVARLTPQ